MLALTALNKTFLLVFSLNEAEQQNCNYKNSCTQSFILATEQVVEIIFLNKSGTICDWENFEPLDNVNRNTDREIAVVDIRCAPK